MDEILRHLAFIIGTTLMYSTPLIFTALGAIYAENSGVVNIGLEGMMVTGAFVGAAVGFNVGNPWIAFICAGLAGGAFGLLHAFASIKYKADQVVSGIAINFLAPGLMLFISRIIFEGATQTPSIDLNHKLPRPLNFIFQPLLEANPDSSILAALNTVFNQYASVYVAFILVFLTWYILYKTKAGLRIRAVGEHPAAADTVGVNVYRIRYICTTLSGVLAGFGGASLSLAIVSSFRPGLVSGHGFIALAAMIFGKWRPKETMMACLLFGATNALRFFLGGLDLGFEIPVDILSMMPYVITIIVLVLFVGRSAGPAASGKPYAKGER